MEMKKVVTGAAALSGLVTLGQTAVNADEIVVQAGDTVSELALKHNTTIEAIEQANKLQNVNLIFVGQRLEVGNNGVFNSQPVQQVQAQAQTPTAEVEQPQQAQAQAQPQQQTQAPQVQAPVAPASDAEASAKAWIANVESGGSYTAQNGRYYGKYQLTDSYLGGDYSPENQERVADNYVSNRYGSWQAAKSFWLANGWY
ncbi:LysM peptidoglycan-binding domain-containing protein [Ligilactobacillus faecis]|uniref:aggregation-promoting factor n=1 Tax=Ligilactobacillus faecis TaxID=762833 RepID=UPI002468D9F2|nr:LysM peptidoglycan-binding domain-containing protein [Ligilactobacillus faecis]WGN88596.1 LysM peptidoglycan-binding domain-containing protein [Ligilactobacillus faecis]